MFEHLKLDLQRLIDDGISKESAIDLVIGAVENEKPKRKKTIEEAVNIAASCTVSKAFSDHRRAICRRAEKISRDREYGTETLRDKVAGLMGFRLPNGTALAEATGTECAEAADFYMTSAKVHYHRANFLRQIAERVGPKKVGKVLDEGALQRFYETAGVLQ